MKTLYVTDLDGTLLNRKDRISDYSKEVLHQLLEQGMPITYATARSLTSVAVVVEGLFPKLPIVVYNGAFVLDAETQEVITSSGFSEAEKTFIVELLHNHKISPLVYAFIEGVEKVSWLLERENEGIQYYINNRKGDKRFRPINAVSQLYEGDVFYFTCIGEREELLPLYNELKEHENYNCVFHQELYREEYWCEILPKKATKANAIESLKERLGYDKIVVFGDARNDIPMFEIADECYAVANAVEELKELATEIIESNEEDGVTRWLLKEFKSKYSYPN